MSNGSGGAPDDGPHRAMSDGLWLGYGHGLGRLTERGTPWPIRR